MAEETLYVKWQKNMLHEASETSRATATFLFTWYEFVHLWFNKPDMTYLNLYWHIVTIEMVLFTLRRHANCMINKITRQGLLHEELSKLTGLLSSMDMFIIFLFVRRPTNLVYTDVKLNFEHALSIQPLWKKYSSADDSQNWLEVPISC